jgi:chromosome partitioning protein
MTVVLATYNIKGGVGKTSAAVNLAYLAARDGARTLLWDLDPQGASTYLFRVKPRIKGGGAKLVHGRTDASDRIKGTDHERLDLLPADFSYRHMDLALDAAKRPTSLLAQVLEPLKPDYDVIILDCPPSISLVSESVFEAADALIVPLIPATLSSRTFAQLREVVADQSEILAFYSMVDARKRLHRDIMQELSQAHPEILHAVIPAAADIERMGSQRTVVDEVAPRGRAAASAAAAPARRLPDRYFFSSDVLSDLPALSMTLRMKSYCVWISRSAISIAASTTSCRRDGPSPWPGSAWSTVSTNLRTASTAAR